MSLHEHEKSFGEYVDAQRQSVTPNATEIPSAAKLVWRECMNEEASAAEKRKGCICPKGERCACYVLGYTDAEYNHGLALDILEPSRHSGQANPIEKTVLTPKQCAEQFRLYARSNDKPEAVHQLNFCADFLDEFCHSGQAVDLMPEDCTLIAHNTGEGWYLAVQNRDGDDIAMLKWPWGNKRKNAQQLEEYGYEII